MKLSAEQIDQFNELNRFLDASSQGALSDDSNFNNILSTRNLQNCFHALAIVGNYRGNYDHNIDYLSPENQRDLSRALYAQQDNSTWKELSPDDQLAILKFRHIFHNLANSESQPSKMMINAANISLDVAATRSGNSYFKIIQKYFTSPIFDTFSSQDYPDKIELSDLKALSSEVFQSRSNCLEINDLPLTSEAFQFLYNKKSEIPIPINTVQLPEFSIHPGEHIHSKTENHGAQVESNPQTKGPAITPDVSASSSTQIDLESALNDELCKQANSLKNVMDATKNDKASLIKELSLPAAKAAHLIADTLYRLEQVKHSKDQFNQLKKQAQSVLGRHQVFNLGVELMTNRELPQSYTGITQYVLRLYDEEIYQTTAKSYEELQAIQKELHILKGRISAGEQYDDNLKNKIFDIQARQRLIARKIKNIGYDSTSRSVEAVGHAVSGALMVSNPVLAIGIGTASSVIGAYTSKKERKKQKKINRYQSYLNGYEGVSQGYSSLLGYNANKISSYELTAENLENALLDPSLYSPKQYRKVLQSSISQNAAKLTALQTTQSELDNKRKEITDKIKPKNVIINSTNKKTSSKQKDQARLDLAVLELDLEKNTFLSTNNSESINNLTDKKTYLEKISAEKEKSSAQDDYVYTELLKIENPEYIGMTEAQIHDARKIEWDKKLPLLNAQKITQARHESERDFVNAVGGVISGMRLPAHLLASATGCKFIESGYYAAANLAEMAIGARDIALNYKTFIQSITNLTWDSSTTLFAISSLVNPSLGLLSLGINLFYPNLIQNPVLLQLGAMHEQNQRAQEFIASKLDLLDKRLEHSFKEIGNQLSKTSQLIQNGFNHTNQNLLEILPTLIRADIQRRRDKDSILNSQSLQTLKHFRSRIFDKVERMELKSISPQDYLAKLPIYLKHAYAIESNRLPLHSPALLAAHHPVDLMPNLFSTLQPKESIPVWGILNLMSTTLLQMTAENTVKENRPLLVNGLNTIYQNIEDLQKTLFRLVLDRKWLHKLLKEYKDSCENLLKMTREVLTKPYPDEYVKRLSGVKSQEESILGEAFVGSAKFYLADAFAHDSPSYLVHYDYAIDSYHNYEYVSDFDGNNEWRELEVYKKDILKRKFGSFYKLRDDINLNKEVQVSVYKQSARSSRFVGYRTFGPLSFQLAIDCKDSYRLAMNIEKIQSPFPKAYDPISDLDIEYSYKRKGTWYESLPEQFSPLKRESPFKLSLIAGHEEFGFTPKPTPGWFSGVWVPEYIHKLDEFHDKLHELKKKYDDHFKAIIKAYFIAIKSIKKNKVFDSSDHPNLGMVGAVLILADDKSQTATIPLMLPKVLMDYIKNLPLFQAYATAEKAGLGKMVPIYRFELNNTKSSSVYMLQISYEFIHSKNDNCFRGAPFITIATLDATTVQSFKKLTSSMALTNINFNECLIAALIGNQNLDPDLTIGLPGAATQRLSDNHIYPLDANFIGLYKICEMFPKQAFHYHHSLYSNDTDLKLRNFAGGNNLPTPNMMSDISVSIDDTELYLKHVRVLTQEIENFRLNQAREFLDEHREQLFSTYETMIGMIRLISNHKFDDVEQLLKIFLGIRSPHIIEKAASSELSKLTDTLNRCVELTGDNLNTAVDKFFNDFMTIKSQFLLDIENHIEQLSGHILEQKVQHDSELQPSSSTPTLSMH